jgi:TPR repeat protein
VNWTVLRVEALLPLVQALGLALLASAAFAFRLHRQGGSSRAALRRFLRFTALAFLLAFTLAALWNARLTLRGLAGAFRGHPRDQYALGLLRQSGRGFLARDPAKAATWFRKAADQGDPDAQLALARACLQGEGVPRNPAEAQRLALASATTGNTEALLLAGDLLKVQDPARSQALYDRARSVLEGQAGRGEAQAMLTLGLLHLQGQGVPVNPVESYAWMLAADRRGLPPLQRVLLVLTGNRLTPAQRAQAAERSKALVPSQPNHGDRRDAPAPGHFVAESEGGHRKP